MIDVRQIQSSARVISKDKIATIVLLGLLFAVCYYIATATWIPSPTDWVNAYRPACLRLLSGESPYAAPPGESGFFNPIWALIPLLPIAILPPVIGEAMLIMCTLLVFGYTAHRLGGSPIRMGAILISFPVVYCLVSGQIDWLVALGLVLPPQWGLLLVTTKPQAGIGIAIFWLWEAWRDRGIKGVIRLVAPTVIGSGITLAIFWANPVLGVLYHGHDLGAWLWPYLVPVGIVLLILAITKHNLVYAMPAAPCLTPYIFPHSLVIVLLTGIRSTAITVLLSLISWGLAWILAITYPH